ncbi:WD40 repeat-containing protein MSI4-like protein [Tanacetum coccineum]
MGQNPADPIPFELDKEEDEKPCILILLTDSQALYHTHMCFNFKMEKKVWQKKGKIKSAFHLCASQKLIMATSNISNTTSQEKGKMITMEPDIVSVSELNSTDYDKTIEVIGHAKQANMDVKNTDYFDQLLWLHKAYRISSTQKLCSVGDDSCLILWDARVGTDLITKVEKTHNADVHRGDWNPKDENYILTRYDQRIETYIEIVHPLPDHFNFFAVRPDAKGLMSFSVIVKCTSVIRQLAYDTSPDALDEYLQIG